MCSCALTRMQAGNGVDVTSTVQVCTHTDRRSPYYDSDVGLGS